MLLSLTRRSRLHSKWNEKLERNRTTRTYNTGYKTIYLKECCSRAGWPRDYNALNNQLTFSDLSRWQNSQRSELTRYLCGYHVSSSRSGRKYIDLPIINLEFNSIQSFRLQLFWKYQFLIKTKKETTCTVRERRTRACLQAANFISQSNKLIQGHNALVRMRSEQTFACYYFLDDDVTWLWNLCPLGSTAVWRYSSRCVNCQRARSLLTVSIWWE